MEEITNFFDRLFLELTHDDSYFIIFTLVGTFLLSFLLGWWTGRSGRRKFKKALKKKEEALTTLKATHAATQEQLELREADLTKAHLELEECKTRISQIELEKAQIDANMAEVNSQFAALQAENLSNLSEIESLNNKVENLETNLPDPSDLPDVSDRGVSALDLSTIENNHNITNARIASIEEKLIELERENNVLRSEISNMKEGDSITFLDDEPGNDDEVLELGVTDQPVVDPEERSALARQQIKAAFGSRIEIASAAEKDDLKKINGIGPFIEQKLNDIGIFTYKQISQFDTDIIQQITDAILFFPGRIERDDWVGQAKQLDA